MKFLLLRRSNLLRRVLVTFLLLSPTFAKAVILSGDVGSLALPAHSVERVYFKEGDADLFSSNKELEGYIRKETIYETVQFVERSRAEVIQLDHLETGAYELTLTDFEFPETMSSLGVSLTSATDSVLNILFEDGEALSLRSQFELESADAYYLSIFGIAGSEYNLGLYGIELTRIGDIGVAAVPLPPAIYLFAAGMAWVFSIARRKRTVLDLGKG